MSRCGKPMTATRKLGVAIFAAILLAAPAVAEDEEPQPNIPAVEMPEPTERVILGVDCSKPLTVSLPDDVLTECEAQ